MKTETNWLRRNGDPYEPTNGAIGFIYSITDTRDGRIYFGKKALIHKKTKPPLAGKKRKRRSTGASDWKTYQSSSDEIKRMVRDGEQQHLRFVVLAECYTKAMLSFVEQAILFGAVLEKLDLINENIAGKFFINKMLSDEQKAREKAWTRK